MNKFTIKIETMFGTQSKVKNMKSTKKKANRSPVMLKITSLNFKKTAPLDKNVSSWPYSLDPRFEINKDL